MRKARYLTAVESPRQARATTQQKTENRTMTTIPTTATRALRHRLHKQQLPRPKFHPIANRLRRWKSGGKFSAHIYHTHKLSFCTAIMEHSSYLLACGVPCIIICLILCWTHKQQLFCCTILLLFEFSFSLLLINYTIIKTPTATRKAIPAPQKHTHHPPPSQKETRAALVLVLPVAAV